MSAPVLSRLFTVKGKITEAIVLNPSTLAEHKSTIHREASSSLGSAGASNIKTLLPNPQSQSFSRSYGSILPTSLTYILLSTRGCSPWRPAAVIGTTRGVNKSRPRFFKDRRKRTGHPEIWVLLPDDSPYLRINRFQGSTTVKKKRELFPELSPMSPSLLALPHNIHVLVEEY